METITELFARDPLELSDKDLDRIIEEMRKARLNFMATGKPAKPEKTAGQDLLKAAGLL